MLWINGALRAIKTRTARKGFFLFALIATNISAATHYVATNGGSISPYTSWADAASNIQWAVNAAAAGETTWVSNGVYYFTNSTAFIASDFYVDSSPHTNFALVSISNKTLRSVNGPADTIIEGYQYGTSNFVGTNNGVFLAYNAVLNGFTVRNCSTTNGVENWNVRSGGGVHVHRGGTISNCVIAGSSASHGGGVYVYPSVNMYNCMISNNMAGAGAGLYLHYCTAGIVRDSIMCDNRENSEGGGGIFIMQSPNVPVTNCVVTRNAGTYGAGIELRVSAKVTNCQIISNISVNGQGGGCYCECSWAGTINIFNSIISSNTSPGVVFTLTTLFSPGYLVLRNCLISANSASGISIYGTVTNNFGTFDSCTIVKNVGGINNTGTITNLFVASNCIIYSNAPSDMPNPTITNCFYNCCATNNLPVNQGNIVGNPQFADWVNNNYRLSPNSPCINRGTNQTWMTNGVDLDGRTRIRYGTVDMGAYEIIYDGTVYRFGF